MDLENCVFLQNIFNSMRDNHLRPLSANVYLWDSFSISKLLPVFLWGCVPWALAEVWARYSISMYCTQCVENTDD